VAPDRLVTGQFHRTVGGAAYDVAVRLTRHARNRLRLLQRRLPGLTEARLIEGLGSAIAFGADVKGNRRMSIRLDEAVLVLVVDEANQVVVTIWREE
jgi:hypothetical protein